MGVNDFIIRRKQSLTLRDYRVDRFILRPDSWCSFKTAIPLIWTRVKFDSAKATSVPDDARGVYTFVAEPGIAAHPACNYLLYVGMVETSDFRTRFKSYLAEPNKKKPRVHVLYMIDRWQPYLWFYYAPLPDGVKAKPVEDSLLEAFLPPVNRNWPARIKDVMRLVFS
jgi:hypothetical protein